MESHSTRNACRLLPVKSLTIAIMMAAIMASCGDDSPTESNEDPTETNSLLNRTSWHQSSRPVQLGEEYLRGKLLWHSPRSLIAFDDVWDREAPQGQGVVRTFRMIFRPQTVSTDTTLVGDQLLVDTVAVGLPSWAGITFPLTFNSPNARTESFDIRARGGHGRMRVEFGRISEDVNGNGFAESEDGIITGSQNGTVEEEEDVGLDGLVDADESEYYHPSVNPDPNGDNWYFEGDGKCPLPAAQCDNIDWDDESIRYEWLNGTEGNINDPTAQGKPDQEALSGGLSMANSYFSFVIDFDSGSFRVPDSNWPSGVAEDRQWWTYRLPINDTMAVYTIVDEDGTPYWYDAPYMRIWFESDPGQAEWDTVEVADWNFVPPRD